MRIIQYLVFVGYFDCLNEAIKKHKEYIKVLIMNQGTSLDADAYLCFDEIIEIKDVHDKETMSHLIEKLQKKGSIKALYATNEGVVEICSYLRSKYAIVGIKEEQGKIVRDKWLMKQLVKEKGIKTAPVQKITAKEDILLFIETYHYPIVIKPQDGSATQNTFLIKNDTALNRALENIDYLETPYIMEGYIEGEEYHCDSVVVDGRVIFSTVGKYLTNLINTIGGQQPIASIVFPTIQEPNDIKQIKNFNVKVIDAFKIKNAITHLEVFVKADGEVIFGEIATRIGGGPLIGKTIKYGYQVDIYEAFVDVELHQFQLPHIESRDTYVGFLAFPTKKGKIKEIASIKDYEGMEGVKEVVIYHQIGDEIEDIDNTTKRTGYIIIEDKTYEDLKTTLTMLYKNFKLVTHIPTMTIANIYG